MNYLSKTVFTILVVVAIFITIISIPNSKYAQWKTLSKFSNNLSDKSMVWFKSINRASVLAKRKKALILVDLWAKWCKPCHKMNKEVFKSKEFNKLVDKYNILLVKLDFTKTNDYTDELSRKYEIMGLPTILILDYNQNLVQSVVGYRNAKKTIAQFEKIFVDFKTN